MLARSSPQENFFLQYRYHDAEQTFLDWSVLHDCVHAACSIPMQTCLLPL